MPTTVNPYDSQHYSTENRVSGTNYGNTVFTDKKNNSNLDSSDFLNLMVAELKNQDFMNPMDNTQYIQQMAQFSSMQAITELAGYSKTNYAMSLVGKQVTATRNTVDGNADTTTGIVQRVLKKNDDYIVYVGGNGKSYKLDQISSVANPQNSGTAQVDPSNITPQVQNVTSSSAKISWSLPTEDPETQKGLQYQVYVSTSASLDTVSKTKAATKVGNPITGVTDPADLTQNFSGLKPNTTYYYNILVTDANGGQSIYKPQTLKTKASG